MRFRTFARRSLFVLAITGVAGCGSGSEEQSLSREEQGRQNAAEALAACDQPGETLTQLRPQMVFDDPTLNTGLEPTDVSGSELLLTDEWTDGYTPTPTSDSDDSESPDPLPVPPSQRHATLSYKLAPGMTITRLYIKPAYGPGTEHTPPIQPGSVGELVFETADYSEDRAEGFFAAGSIESVSVCLLSESTATSAPATN